MSSNSIISRRAKPSYSILSVSLHKMTRSSADRKIKLRKLGRKLKAQFKPRPLSGSFNARTNLRTAKSVASLRSLRNLQIHQVSEPTPVPSIRHHSVRFSHPAVRYVISALPTPLSTAGRTIPQNLGEYDSPATVDFPGQVNASAIYHRRSKVTNTILFEDIYNQLDGVLAHPHSSKLLRRREERKKANDYHGNTIAADSNSQANDKPWPVEGICGTIPGELKTKSGLKALQYLSFQAPIQEEAFSDEAIFKTSRVERSKEQHLQATLDQLNIPREEVKPTARPLYPLSLQPSVHQPIECEQLKRPPFLALDPTRHSTLAMIPEISSAKQMFRKNTHQIRTVGKQPEDRRSQQNLEWEKALLTVQQRHVTARAVSSPDQTKQLSTCHPTVPITIESSRPNTAASTTPDFPITKSENLNRHTLLQSTALDLGLTTPAGAESLITPRFTVLDRERELRRRTFIGEQQRDLALTPYAVPAAGAPAALPRAFSIPRRGVGQAPKAQAHSGLLLPASVPGSGQSTYVYPPAPRASRAAMENIDQRGASTFGSCHALQDETPAKPKLSRMAMLRKIITKNY